MESNTQEPKRPGLFKMHKTSLSISSISSAASSLNSNLPLLKSKANDSAIKAFLVIKKFGSFIGPGFLVAVAYIDPGNYSTDVSAGASNKYALLFVVIMSNMFAIFLQSLCIKLGSVTGMDLAENCRAHLPKWMVIPLYVLAEAAIIATDIAEVIGSAIALNLLANIPLVAGCAITLVDVLFLLLFYRPHGNMNGLRVFEYFVMGLVLAVVICFCIQLSLIRNQSVGEVFRGYLPSSAVVKGDGLYQSCGILGATVMPHSLFLGSGVVQPRLKEFDEAKGNVQPAETDYRPSIEAIRSCMKYSIAELAISLFTFALFVNSSILIVAGASLFGTDGASDADLFGIYKLLSSSIAPAAGTVFALALLLSGLSAAFVPSIIIAAAIGKSGLSAALNASQVTLSVILPFVSAPLVYFTCFNKFMTVKGGTTRTVAESDSENESMEILGIPMRNSWYTATLAVLIWLVIAIMNVALLVLVGLGKA
ncbi:hypothetical protein DTO169C6_5319 [Paecilomyces variotii]|nr:hypothetical protein DTO169C6_5319 [Paecilomyces variotii]KAJ9387732.1 hypothetical protein DTO063F5_2958 [Paecilomyces variotii]